MSRVCDICGKRPLVGMKVSHSHHRTKKRTLPNLQTVKVQTAKGPKRMTVCTRCIRSGKITKAA
ncbi:MAG TPA: 50S ribosomal protein L28 [bacterium]|nr:50S ribosomal protein L28 [bacterium]